MAVPHESWLQLTQWFQRIYEYSDVGDEFHYVLECCFFDFDRKIFFPHIKRKPVNCFTYANVFNDTNFRRLRPLCNFLKSVIDTFRSRPR